MSKLKPDFIRTARAFRRITDRMFKALAQGKPTHLIVTRRARLYSLYHSQVKITA